MADDKLTAALAEIRERNERRIEFARYTEWTVEHEAAEGDVRRLLAVVDAVLEHHKRVPLYERVYDYKGNVTCGHDADYDGDRHFEGDDNQWLCADEPAGEICSSCIDGEGGEPLNWPCPTYEAIQIALTGKAADDA